MSVIAKYCEAQAVELQLLTQVKEKEKCEC